MDKIKKYRFLIDKCDKKICKNLIKRFQIVKLIGEYKKANHIQVLDNRRENLVKQKVRQLVKNSMPKNSIEKIYQCIMNEAKDIQK
ncbi:MAG: chorismate mutase [Mycoplasmataceae bacterium]|jgi:chorismate mutase|nr:chorismate mutase [Mycoplasmataceae bacterium]